MPFIDSDSSLSYLMTVLLVTTLVTVIKFLFFIFEHFYVIRKMIYMVIKQLSSSNSSSSNSGKSDQYDAEIEKDFDTHLVNLLRYLENNQAANQRLDTVDAESSRYIGYHNLVMVVRFFTVILILTVLTGMIYHYKYGSFLTEFWASIKAQ